MTVRGPLQDWGYINNREKYPQSCNGPLTGEIDFE